MTREDQDLVRDLRQELAKAPVTITQGELDNLRSAQAREDELNLRQEAEWLAREWMVQEAAEVAHEFVRYAYREGLVKGLADGDAVDANSEMIALSNIAAALITKGLVGGDAELANAEKSLMLKRERLEREKKIENPA